MGLVHTFNLVTELFTDTRFPLQYPGGGNPAAAKQVELSLLVEFLATQLAIGTTAQTIVTGDTISVTNGNLITCIAVEAVTGARTIKIGTTAGADDVLEEMTIPTLTDLTFTLNRYTSTGLTLHFTLTGGSADVLLFTQSKS